MPLSLSSIAQVNSFIILFNFITWRGLFFNLEVPIYKYCKRGYLDEKNRWIINYHSRGKRYICFIISLNLISFEIITIDVFILIYRIWKIDGYGFKKYTSDIICIYYWRKMTSAVLFGCFEIWKTFFTANSDKMCISPDQLILN